MYQSVILSIWAKMPSLRIIDATTCFVAWFGTPKIINFPFVPNGKFIIFRCPNLYTHYGNQKSFLIFTLYFKKSAARVNMFIFVAPALARCDIGVRFSVRPSTRSSVRLFTFTSTLNFKSIQMTFSLKPLHPWFSNFTCCMTRLQGFWMTKFSLVQNPRWPLLLKIAKTLKSLFSPEPLGIFGWNFTWSINGTLVLKIIKMKKICSGIRSQWPTFCLRVRVCKNANI